MEKREEFEALAMAALPHLNALCEVAKEHKLGSTIVSIVVGGDGYIDLSTSVYRHWCISRFPDGEPKIRYKGTPVEELED